MAGQNQPCALDSFNLLRSQLKKRGEIGLNQSLIQIYPIPPNPTLIFYWPPLQLSKGKGKVHPITSHEGPEGDAVFSVK
jgi:hypothetical protein